MKYICTHEIYIETIVDQTFQCLDFIHPNQNPKNNYFQKQNPQKISAYEPQKPMLP